MRTYRCSDRADLVGALAALAVLAWSGPEPAQARAAVRDPGAWLAQHGAAAGVTALAAAAAWVALGWLLVGALAVSLSRRPGTGGRAGAAVARRVLPRPVRHALEAALGAALVTGPGLPALAAADAAPPTATAPPAGPFERPAAPAAAPTPPARIAAPASASRPAAEHPPATRPTAASPVVVVVAPGDSLWSIAARHLPPGATDGEVARAWPRWYTRNAGLIGDDPDLIRPGQQLVPPTH